MSTTTNNALQAMLEQYEKSVQSSSEKKYDLKNYFSTGLDKDQKKATKTVRIVPTKDGTSPFTQIETHKGEIDGATKYFPCLQSEENKPCPFCEINKALRATGEESDKELAKKFSSRKMYVVKVIDRDNEEDGIKFWRFNHDYRKTGIFDKIMSIVQTLKCDISDKTTGRDLAISIARDTNGYSQIQNIIHKEPSPLSDDAELMKEWINDERTWRDVYSVRDYEYLKIVAEGGKPYWDKVGEKWVDKTTFEENKDDEGDNLESELSIGSSGNEEIDSEEDAQPVTAEEEDDLPF